MNILLIGGNGFIGRYVIKDLLAHGQQVSVFHRGKEDPSIPNVRNISGDRNRLAEFRGMLKEIAPDVVVDFVLSSKGQAEMLMSTVRGVVSRVVALSSMDVYRACAVLHETEGGGLQPLPLTEDSELRTAPPYTAEQLNMVRGIFSWLGKEYDKIPVERVVMSDPELPGTVLRLPMVYGPGDPLHRFYPVIRRILDGRRYIIYSEDAAQWRATMGYVEDVARAIALAARSDHAAGRVYNLGEAEIPTELEWAKMIAAELEWKGEFVVMPRERAPEHLLPHGNYAQHWVASTRRIREELGYRELFPRSEALRRTIAWERKHAPASIPPGQFNYPEEDRALAAFLPQRFQPSA